MSITLKEIEKLAELSRIHLAESEKETFTKDIDSVLAYVEQIKEVVSSGDTHADKKPADIIHRNALREDIADTHINPDPSVLVELAPSHEQGFIKVKKILG